MSLAGPVTEAAARHRSFWLDEALATEEPSTTVLSGRHRFDVAIVGGGFCGLWTAINLVSREPTLRVAIVERDICGGGAPEPAVVLVLGVDSMRGAEGADLRDRFGGGACHAQRLLLAHEGGHGREARPQAQHVASVAPAGATAWRGTAVAP